MGEIKETKLRHVMKASWESEEMPGWEDSLSAILGAIKKEFNINTKDTMNKSKDFMLLEQDNLML